jgi:hypothetical protein
MLDFRVAQDSILVEGKTNEGEPEVVAEFEWFTKPKVASAAKQSPLSEAKPKTKSPACADLSAPKAGRRQTGGLLFAEVRELRLRVFPFKTLSLKEANLES